MALDQQERLKLWASNQKLKPQSPVSLFRLPDDLLSGEQPEPGSGVVTFATDWETTPLPITEEGYTSYENVTMTGGSGTGLKLQLILHNDYPNGVFGVSNAATGSGYKVGDLVTSNPDESGGYTVTLWVAEVV